MNEVQEEAVFSLIEYVGMSKDCERYINQLRIAARAIRLDEDYFEEITGFCIYSDKELEEDKQGYYETL